MKKASRSGSEVTDDLRQEYRFDYSKARPNPYAARLKGRVVAVVLEPEVAAAFPTSESVNKALRSVMGLVRRRSSRRSPSGTNGRSSTELQRTRAVKVRRRGTRR